MNITITNNNAIYFLGADFYQAVKIQTNNEQIRGETLRGLERASVYQMNIGTVSKATLGKLLKDGVEHIWAFLSNRYYLELN